jgi:hypothetical protein
MANPLNPTVQNVVPMHLDSTYPAGVCRRSLEGFLRLLSRFENEGFGAVLPKSPWHGAAIRRRTASFSSLRANDAESAIPNLEQDDTVSRWGRLIFHVTNVDAFWIHLKERI